MVRDILKTTGKILTAVIILISASAAAYSAEIKSELVNSRIETGDSTVLKVMISGSTSNIRPVKVPAVEGLSISLSGTSRSFQFINGKTWTGIILSFTITGEKKGVYRIPRFVIEADGEKLQTGEYTLIVTEGSSGAGTSTGNLRGEVEISAGDVYAGEPLLMRYYINTTDSGIRIEGMKEQPDSRGFVMKSLKEEKLENEQGGGRTYIASYCLVATESGKHELGGGILSVIAEVSDGFFSRGIRREIRFPKKSVTVRALPIAGKPAEFNGDVGEFSIDSGEASGSYRAGDEITIPVKVKGRGNLIMMSRPAVEKQEGFRVLVEEKEPELSVDNRTLTGEKEFTVIIIPEKEGECRIGKIFLTFFNPYKGVYEKTESREYSFHVLPASSEKKSGEEKTGENGKTSLPHIILIIAVIIIAGCGIILYLQTGRYRIVRADKVIDADTDPEPEKNVDYNAQLRGDFEKAFAEKNHKLFLLTAEKLSGSIYSESPGSAAGAELRRIREKIDLCRYGGASLSDDDMKEIYSVIKKGF